VIVNFNPRPAKRRPVSQYEREPGDWQSCIELERNGLLHYVEDIETGERDWKANFEVR
jgi:hypothetical protein